MRGEGRRTFGLPSGTRRVVLVTHGVVDTDAIASLVMMETLLKDLRFGGEVAVAFIPLGTTYRDIAVDPRHWYEEVGSGEVVVHLDIGGSMLDNHREDCGSVSSARLVDRTFGFCDQYPEWGGVLENVDLSEQGTLHDPTSLSAIISGQHRVLGKGQDLAVLWFGRRVLEALLANSRVGLEARRIPIQKVASFTLGESAPVLQFSKAFPIRVGLVLAPEDHLDYLGVYRRRLEQSGCQLVISFCAGRAAVMSCYPSEKLAAVCLGKLGIVLTVRQLECQRRGDFLLEEELRAVGTSLGWFAQQVQDADGATRLANLFNGTSKHPPLRGEQTRLQPQEIVEAVISCLK